jgi:Cu-Zn family superoxide dismutase
MKTVLMTLCAATLLAACGQKGEQPTAPESGATATPSTPPVAPPAEPAASGAAVQLAATQGHSARGSLTLTAEADGVRLTGSVEGLKPTGEFGFHIHEVGDCSAPDASSAGPHFNPANAAHGNPEGGAHHAGDMYNLKSDGQGVAKVDVLARGTTLGGGQATDVSGRAVVVHEKADDYSSQPAGDSGDRISCGVVTPN